MKKLLERALKAMESCSPPLMQDYRSYRDSINEIQNTIANWTEEPTPRKRLTDEDIIEVACYVNSFINGSALTFAREIEKRILEGV